MERAYEYRIYPSNVQREQIERTFGCCRWVYNRCLETRMAEREAAARPSSVYGLQKMIPDWKRGEAPWLAEADSTALQTSVVDLGRAYENFFAKRAGFPRFKSKHDPRQSYRSKRVGDNIAVVDRKHVKLPKLGAVKAKISRMPEGRILNATIKRSPTGKYFCVMCCTGCPEPHVPAGPVGVMGVDAGVHDLAVCSDGARFPNPRSLRGAERRLAREQRRLSRKKRGSANRERQRAKVARCHEKVTNRRRDALHKATTAIVRESQAVAVEDLNVRGMMANRRLARAVADASMGELLRQLEYKCAWYGRGFAKVGRFYPSSKTCGECGAVFGGLTLDMRKWVCPECGCAHDRDLNAARNIAREGKRILDGTVGHTGTAAA